MEFRDFGLLAGQSFEIELGLVGHDILTAMKAEKASTDVRSVWDELRPGSEIVACLKHLESQALRHINELRAWRRSDGSGEMEPVDLIREAFVWGDEWFDEKAGVLGADRITRLQWRGMPTEWWSPSRIAARTRNEAVIAWLQVSENAAHEIARIENARSFVVAVSSSVVAVVALLVSGISVLVQLIS